MLAFYAETGWMFCGLELLRRSPAMHAGLWGPGVRSHAAALEQINRALAARAGLATGGRVLDAGCGAGSSVLWLRAALPLHAVGLTIVPQQARRGARMAARRPAAGRADFLCGDYGRAGLASGAFDAVWALESFCHAADLPAALAEAFRLLRPGGRLVLADRLRRRRDDARGQALLGRWLAAWAMPALPSADELAAAMVAAGFAAPAVEDVTDLAWPSLRYLGLLGGLGLPAAALLRAAGLLSRAQLAGLRGCLDQYRSLRRGLWGYYLLSARRP